MTVAWQKARTTHRPLLIVVTTDGCRYCEQLKRDTLNDQSVQSEIEHAFVPTTVNASDQPSLMRKLQIESYPTTVIISPQGRVLGTIEGYVAPDKFRARLASVSNNTGG